MKKIKLIIKPLIFIFIFLIILGIVSPIFIPKNNSQEAGMHTPTAYGFLGEKPNTIDVLAIGDSESYSAISPMEIYQNYGYTSYVCGTPRQKLYQSYDFLKKALEKHKIKVVFLETNAIFRKINPWDYLQFKSQEFFPILEYHNRWKTLNENDLKEPNYTWTHFSKGYRFNTKTSSATINKNYMQEKNETRNIRKVNYYFLNKIKFLCDENNIKLVFVSTPSLKNWNYEKHNGVQRYADENKIEYIDMNLLSQDIPINWKKETRDKGDHLNYKGALKVSHYLGQYLKGLNIVKDHRNDQKYISWNKDLNLYKDKVKKKIKF